jgi:hypothetical protein
MEVFPTKKEAENGFWKSIWTCLGDHLALENSVDLGVSGQSWTGRQYGSIKLYIEWV